MRNRVGVSVALLATVASLVFTSVAGAIPYYDALLYPNNFAYSGWNYWFANDDQKGCYCGSVLYFENSSTIKGAYEVSGYQYVDRNMLGIGGYLRGSVSNPENFAFNNTASVCTC